MTPALAMAMPVRAISDLLVMGSFFIVPIIAGNASELIRGRAGG